ncbi:acylphosphatase [Aeromicrobium sp. CTD01-1L150]|uniref:acylphosphatase n=1 Tax=Aeromicrobium sp. CTD01-1L150 TaxID=3341830 RepID=UPI0035C09E09
MVRRRVVVHGRVQGVFFRARCAEQAAAAGVTGWVANQPDGTVEAVFEGEEAAVSQMLTWCHEGSERAQVSSVDVLEEQPEGLTGFDHR